MKKGHILSSLVGFAIGAAVGALAATYILKDEYEQIANEEIESVKKVFEEKITEYEKSVKTSNEYAEILRNEVYRMNHKHREEEYEMDVSPCIITEEEFSQSTNPMMSLTYCADGVLVDEDGYVVKPEECVGQDVLDEFDNQEEDVMYVRSEALEIDYEISFDERDSSDVIAALRPGEDDDD